MFRIDLRLPLGRDRSVVRQRLIAAAIGAAVAAVAVGTRPGFAAAPVLGVVGGVLAFAGLLIATVWASRTIGLGVWRWAIGFGAALATAAIVGVIVRGRATPGGPVMVGWLAIRWLGLGWLAACLFAAVAHLVDQTRSPKRPVSEAEPYEQVHGVRAFVAALPQSLISGDRAVRRRSLLVIIALLVVARVPALVIWWPGIVYSDTRRSFEEVLGLISWGSYEPVGHSLLVGLAVRLGLAFGRGESGAVPLASLAQIAAMTAAFTLLLVRLVRWGVPRALWFTALGWLVLSPLFAFSSITIMKDESFSVAFVFFMVALVDLVFAARSGRHRWQWVMLTVSAVFLIGTRNNGSYVVLLSLPVLLIMLRRFRRQLLAVLVVVVAAYAAYVGPLYSALHVVPGPKAEAYSIPIQQMARIAKVHGPELSAADRRFLTMAFERPPEDFTGHYVPQLSDPMKDYGARESWATNSTARMLTGWLRLVAKYPGTAIAATLANTVGYWDPTSSSYDGVTLTGSTDVYVRTAGVPTTGFRAWLLNSGIVPVKSYWSGQSDSGYLTIPGLGSAMSPGFVTWVWIGSLLLVVRRRGWSSLVLFVPPAVLALTVLAGPVSGGQRYSLPFFMTLPLAAAIPFLVRPPWPARITAAASTSEQQKAVVSADTGAPR